MLGLINAYENSVGVCGYFITTIWLWVITYDYDSLLWVITYDLRSKLMRIRISFVQKCFSGWFRWCRPILIKSSSFDMRWRHRFSICHIAIPKCRDEIGNTRTKIFDKHMSNSSWQGSSDCRWHHIKSLRRWRHRMTSSLDSRISLLLVPEGPSQHFQRG